MAREVFDCPVDRVVRVVTGEVQQLILDRGWNSFQGTYTQLVAASGPIIAPRPDTVAGRLVTEVVRMWLSEASRAKYQLRWISESLGVHGKSHGDFKNLRDSSGQSLSEYLLERGLVKPHTQFVNRYQIWTPEELQLAVAAAQGIIGD